MTSPTTAGRLHAMDALRAYALLGGVVLHACMSFVPNIMGWVVVDSRPSMALAWLFFVIHAFRMPTFFLIAGFFARMLLHRRGPRGFIRNRLAHIALPAAVGWPVLYLAVSQVFAWGTKTMNDGVLPPGSGIMDHPVMRQPGAFPMLHLWFLYFLVLFYAAALALSALAARGGAPALLLKRTGAVLAAILKSPWAPLAFAAPLAVALYYEPVWLMWFGIPAPDKNFIPDQPALAGYGAAFVAGWLLHARPDLIGEIERRWLPNMVMAGGLLCGAALIGGQKSIDHNQPWGGPDLAAACVYSAAVFAATFAVVGAAHRFVSGQSAWRRYLADASYWIYLVHLPLVMGLQIAVSQLDWPAWIKLIVILGAAVPMLLISYELFVRDTVIGTMLNGRRRARASLPHPLVLSGEAKP